MSIEIKASKINYVVNNEWELVEFTKNSNCYICNRKNLVQACFKHLQTNELITINDLCVKQLVKKAQENQDSRKEQLFSLTSKNIIRFFDVKQENKKYIHPLLLELAFKNGTIDKNEYEFYNEMIKIKNTNKSIPEVYLIYLRLINKKIVDKWSSTDSFIIKNDKLLEGIAKANNSTGKEVVCNNENRIVYDKIIDFSSNQIDSFPLSSNLDEIESKTIEVLLNNTDECFSKIIDEIVVEKTIDLTNNKIIYQNLEEHNGVITNNEQINLNLPIKKTRFENFKSCYSHIPQKKSIKFINNNNNKKGKKCLK